MNIKYISAAISITSILVGIWFINLYSAPADNVGSDQPIVVPTSVPLVVPLMPPRTMLSNTELNAYRQELKKNESQLRALRATFKKVLKQKHISSNFGDRNKLAVVRNDRALVRLLTKESEVRIANGDAKGAMDSRLDILRLSAFASQGGTIEMLSGSAIEDLAFENAMPIFFRLNGDECLDFEGQIAEIQGFKPSFTNALMWEKARQLKQLKSIYGTSEWKALLSPKSRTMPEPTFSDIQIKQLKALSKLQLEEDLIEVYVALIARSELDYSQAKNVKFSLSLKPTPYSILVANEDADLSNNYIFARIKTEINLFRAELLKRAMKVGTSKPFDFTKRLPLDPFGKGQLKTNGDLIYSVGPDGVDDKGVPVPQLKKEAKGDILAPSF